MRCILLGHVVVRQEGSGEYKGRASSYCAFCGKIFTTDGEAPALKQQTTRDPLPHEQTVTL
ncbi:MAG: hypothetical protein WCP82_08785 [Alphaproteobacteria bacterium]